MALRERVKLFLRGLAKFIALVALAGAVGVGLGTALSTLSADTETTTPDVASGTTAGATTGAPSSTTTTTAAPPASTAPAAAPPATTATATTTTVAPSPPPNRFAEVRVDVLDARLHTDDTPSGRQEQNARVTVRVRADNAGSRRVTLTPPTLRIGSVRVPVDASAGAARLAPLAAGAAQTVTLRFSLAGEATPKLVRDRRARIFIAGRSLAMRVRVRNPT